MAEQSSWRSSSTAEHYAAHDFADFAQEYLRRNGDYQRDWAETEMRAANTSDPANQLKEGLAERWGLCFPLCTRCISQRKSGFVVDRGYAGCRSPRRSSPAIEVHPAAQHRNISRPIDRWRTAPRARIRRRTDPLVLTPGLCPERGSVRHSGRRPFGAAARSHSNRRPCPFSAQQVRTIAISPYSVSTPPTGPVAQSPRCFA